VGIAPKGSAVSVPDKDLLSLAGRHDHHPGFPFGQPASGSFFKDALPDNENGEQADADDGSEENKGNCIKDQPDGICYLIVSDTVNVPAADK
jgi:hypothetical protein